MHLDHYLQRTDVLDCTGRVTHTLTLRLDGTVQVTFASGRVGIADPESRTSRTPGVAIPEHLWAEIVACRF